MTLVFPTSKPLGANNRNSREAIKDDAAFPTKVIDYLKIDIYGHEHDEIIDTVYLYLPNKLSEKYTAEYKNVTLGPAGNAAVGAAKKIVSSEGDFEGTSFKGELKNFAKAAKPSLAFGAGAKAISATVGVTGQGMSSLSGNDLAALTTGKIFNPYEEAIFSGTSFRNHTFSFKMQPKNAQDVQTIYQIIHTFRTSMLPGKDGNNWLTLPEYFRVAVVRYTDNGKNETITNPGYGAGGGMLNALMQFPTKMVLKGVDVDLAPDGNYASLQSWSPGNNLTDFGPASYQMTLNFQETQFLTKESFDTVTSRNSGYFNFGNNSTPYAGVSTTPPGTPAPAAEPPNNSRSRTNPNYWANRRAWRRGGRGRTATSSTSRSAT